MMEKQLATKLSAQFSPEYLQVINESHQHSGSRTDSHFKVIVVSHFFTDMKLIARHRTVNVLFAEELNHIHALAIHTYTPEEWQRKKKAPESPRCQSVPK